VLLCVALLIGAEPCQAEVARLYAVRGEVLARARDTSVWKPVQVDHGFNPGDTLRTGADGDAAVRFVDGALVRLARHTVVTFEEMGPLGAPGVFQAQGQAHYFTRGARREPTIRTPLVNAAIFGTEVVVDLENGAAAVQVLHGAVGVSSAAGAAGAQKSLRAGEQGLVQPVAHGSGGDDAILVQHVASSIGVVQRFIAVPPFVLSSEGEDPAFSLKCSALTSAAMLHQQLQAAARTAAQGGGFDEVVGLANDLSAADPCDRAWGSALRGLYALELNDVRAARSALMAAREVDVDLVAVSLLAAQLLQLDGELDAALAEVRHAIELAPHTPQLFEREAELLLSLDRTTEAAAVLQERVQRWGESAETSILAGFLALGQKEYARAEEHFERARVLSSSAALAYLGLGLVRVARQEYGAAKDLFSQAVQLAPQVSVYRSYLGKLLFEDEQSVAAVDEFDLATTLDRNDPTPHLYRGLAQLALNRPLQGLADVERAIELNDQRAVYRSRLLLDRDLGVRSAGLSKVFTEVGFREVARIEAIRSLAADYGNFSAHRLLAESYTSILGNEARQSELRIADLLSPLSFNLFTSSGEVASAGEYNALFDKRENRRYLGADLNSDQPSLSVGAAEAGKEDRYGYLMSYRPLYQYGRRAGRFGSDHQLRGAVQYEPQVGVRTLLDTSVSVRESKGLSAQEYAEDVRDGEVRWGGKVDLGPRSSVLVQAEAGRTRLKTRQFIEHAALLPHSGSDDPVLFDLPVDEAALNRVTRGSLSTQLLHTSAYLDVVSGAEGLLARTRRSEDSQGVVYDEFDQEYPIDLSSQGQNSLGSAALYHYMTWKWPRFAALTTGVAAAHIERDTSEVAPFVSDTHTHRGVSPKFGLVLAPFSWLTTRAQYSEGVRKSLLEDMSSLEPTLLGGINQRYNDLSATQSRNLGFGVDIKERGVWYSGVEYVRRNLAEPYTVTYNELDPQLRSDRNRVTQGPAEETHSEVDLWRGYLYRVVSRSVALGMEYEGSSYRSVDPSNPERVQTGLARATVRYFHDTHWSALLQSRYRFQNLNLNADPGAAVMVDAGIFYRFAERHGMFSVRLDNIFGAPYQPDLTLGLDDVTPAARTVMVGWSYNF
jgi:tetratricopeptide (TPR) repeat protein